MPLVNEDMIVNTVDDKDIPIGVIRRGDVFVECANFRVVHILVFNSAGELLLQRLARTRRRHPGYWGSSVAGYLYAAENYEQAAVRRLSQELGIMNADLRYFGKIAMNDEGCTKFIEVFTTTHNGPFRIDRSQIDVIEFFPLDTINHLCETGAVALTPTFIKVLDFYEREHAPLN